MLQSKVQSLVEAAVNVVIGAVVALVSQLLIFPQFGIHIPMSSNLGILFWFTLVSVIRSYVIRRWFNKRLHAIAHSVAKELGERDNAST